MPPTRSNPLLGGAGLDGAAYLPAALASHLPLDAVAIMLGTNDLKAQFARPPERIAAGAKRLLDIARTLDGGIGTAYPNPALLLICPPPLGNFSPYFVEMFAGGEAKSRALPAALRGGGAGGGGGVPRRRHGDRDRRRGRRAFLRRHAAKAGARGGRGAAAADRLITRAGARGRRVRRRRRRAASAAPSAAPCRPPARRPAGR